MKVLLFAGLKEVIGDAEISVDVVGKTVEQVKRLIAEQHPDAQNLIERSHFAVGKDYVSDSYVFESTPDEIAIIPPVSGG